MPQYSVHDAKTNLSKLISSALDGADVVIARGNIPAVRLVPVNALGKRSFGAYKGKISIDKSFEEPLPDDELLSWNAP
jgi:antitoxin (DNA-binding transcriptional repressor) of toxin-antitoxin stability system